MSISGLAVAILISGSRDWSDIVGALSIAIGVTENLYLAVEISKISSVVTEIRVLPVWRSLF